MQQEFLTLDYEEDFIVKGCLDSAMEGRNTRLQMVNSLKTECTIEFREAAQCQDWKATIEQKAQHIENFLKKDKIQIGSIGEIQASSLSAHDKMTLIGAKLDNKNDFDHLVKDDPFQLQQSYEATFESLTIILDCSTKYTLRSKCANGRENDQLIYSVTKPPQLNRPNKESSDRFVFLVSANKFYFGFFYREFDQDLAIALQSVELVDRSPDVVGPLSNE